MVDIKRYKLKSKKEKVDERGVGVEASIKLFCLAFGFGFGWNSLVSERANCFPFVQNQIFSVKGLFLP